MSNNDKLRSPISVEIRDKYVNDAIDAAKDLGYELSFESDPTETIDAVALEMNSRLDEINRYPDPDLLLSSIAIKNAAVIVKYLQDVAEIEGEWFKDDDRVGMNTYPFVVGDLTVFPMAWIMKRMLDGELESVVTKYAEFRSHIK